MQVKLESQKLKEFEKVEAAILKEMFWERNYKTKVTSMALNLEQILK